MPIPATSNASDAPVPGNKMVPPTMFKSCWLAWLSKHNIILSGNISPSKVMVSQLGEVRTSVRTDGGTAVQAAIVEHEARQRLSVRGRDIRCAPIEINYALVRDYLLNLLRHSSSVHFNDDDTIKIDSRDTDLFEEVMFGRGPVL